MYQKSCLNCGEDFKSEREVTKFCCWDCMIKYRQKHDRLIRAMINDKGV